MLTIKSPQSYHHRPGICAQAGEFLAPLARHFAIITSPSAWAAVNPQLERSLAEHGIRYSVEFLAGECSREAIDYHRDRAQRLQASGVLGIGGGRVLDCAKAAGDELRLPVVTLPTIAATCAAWSPVSILYHPQGGHQSSRPLTHMPALVLVDSEVIARTDVRYLKAGIVDALAKWYEFQPYRVKNDANLALGFKVQAAQFALETLRAFGPQAVRDNQERRVTPALMRVIDANIAGAGLANSMRDDMPAPGVAHAIHNRLTHQAEFHGWLHGEVVGLGLLVQSLLEHGVDHPDAGLLALLQQYDMPLTLPPLAGSRAEAIKHIAAGVKFPAVHAERLPFSLTAADIERALQATDEAPWLAA